jgi:hypothetical protein
MRRLLSAYLLAAALAWSQTTINGSRMVLGAWDASGAATTKPAKAGTTLPATCAVGEIFYKTDATPGSNLYGCTATNVWTGQGGGGGGDAYLANTQSWAGKNSWTPTANQALTAAGNAILCDGNVVQVTPASDLVLTSAPTIAAGTSGHVCTIVNLSAAYSVTLQDATALAGSGLRLSGSSATIPRRGALTLIYSASVAAWVQFNSHPEVKEFNEFLPRRTSATNLEVNGGRITVGTKTFYVPNDATCALTATVADTAWAYWQNGSSVIGMNDSGSSVACSGWDTATGITTFPAGSVPLWSWSAVSTPGQWDVGGWSDYRALAGGQMFSAGTGVTATPNPTTGIAALAVDTATTPQFTSGTATVSGSCTIGQIYLETDTGIVSVCTATNTWTSMAQSPTAQKIWLQAVTCSGTAATLNWDTIATLAPTVACTAGTTNTGLIRGLASFSNSEISQMQNRIALPSDWTGAIDLKFRWQTSAITGSVVWQAASVCVADGDVNDAAWNAASTVTDAALGTTLWTNDASITGLTATGCAAGELLHLKIFRDPDHASDDLAATADLIGVEVVTRRAQ